MIKQEPVTMREKLRSPGFCLRKLREKGLRRIPSWLCRRLIQAVNAPFRAAQIRRANADLVREQVGLLESDTLYAFYDLDLMPITFDVVTFLCNVQREQRKGGFRRAQVVIVPGKTDGFNDMNLKLYDLQQAVWRISHILVPASLLVPDTSVMVASTREQARALRAQVDGLVFPAQYTVDCPTAARGFPWRDEPLAVDEELPELRPTAAGRDVIQSWAKAQDVGSRRIVTITLREASFYPERNADLQAWAAFATGLDRKRYFPVIIRDFEKAFQPLPPMFDDVPCFNEAIWSLELRLALYERSYICMSASTGPDVLCQVGGKRFRYLIFKLLVPENLYCTQAYYYDIYGIRAGEQLPIATRYQRLVWEDDSLESIQRAFAELVAEIEDGLGADFLPS
jgi:hypothetical protein